MSKRRIKALLKTNISRSSTIVGVLVDENNKIISQHCSSDVGWLTHDLITSGWHHKKCIARYPEGYEIDNRLGEYYKVAPKGNTD